MPVLVRVLMVRCAVWCVDAVVFNANSTGRATVIVYEFSELGRIGKLDSKMVTYGHVVRTTR